MLTVPAIVILMSRDLAQTGIRHERSDRHGDRHLIELSIVLLLCFGVVVSGVIARLLPASIPLPLIQIALGGALAMLGGIDIALNPDLFFLVFLPPLLFLDAWRIQKQGFFHDITAILSLSLGLVLFTVLGLGLLLHWLIPAIPLAAAFALAAILSPTDPVAVSAIARTVPVPTRLMHILEGESLLNDASGLVCMRFAVAALASGMFSMTDAAASFAWTALGGLLIGGLLSWLANAAKDVVALRLGEDAGTQILFSLLIPFGAYLLAEEAGASGVLAAVAAGIVMSYSEQSGRGLATTRVRRNAVWDTLQVALNGAMFILLGEQFPKIISQAARLVSETGHQNPSWLLLYVVFVVLALAILRFAWVWVSLLLARQRANLRLIVATSIAGVRGAITLAGVLSLPLVLDSGRPFPERDLIIFIAASVIILSLLLASVALPICLQGLDMPAAPLRRRQEQKARATAARAALEAIESLRERIAPEDEEIASHVAERISDSYRERLKGLAAQTRSKRAGTVTRSLAIERDFMLAALRAERDVLNESARKREIPDDMARRLVRELDLAETRIMEHVHAH